jgi:N-acetylglucosaminyldiphosphoundecaprenol N-acetyl-beta-D-mannosaminyltransferase
MLQTTQLLGVSITNESDKNILEYVLERLKTSKNKFVIVTPNPEIITYAQSDTRYKQNLNEAEIALPDGIGIVLASMLLGNPISGRFTGVDFIEKLCMECSENPISMGFLGGRNNVAMQSAECLQKKYPWIKISYVGEEWPLFSKDMNQLPSKSFDKSSKEFSLKQHIDILFVAFGFPKQEQWIFENLEKLPVTAAMGVGGAFDFISGVVPRAPRIIRLIGLEWLFRLLIQPWRIKRQLSLLKFSVLVVKEWVKKNARKNEQEK